MAYFQAAVLEYKGAVSIWRQVDDKQFSDIRTSFLSEYYAKRMHVKTENTKKH